MGTRETTFVTGLDARVTDILEQCTGCGRCVEVCPTAEPGGVDKSDPRAVVADVLDILRGAGNPQSVGARWAETCTGSGQCLRACEDGVNPRFMLAMTRVALNQRKAEADRRSAGQTGFNTMSRGVKVLSRLQLPADLVARVTRSPHASRAPPAFALDHVVPYIAARLDQLTPHFVHRVDKRVALHEHPGVGGVTEGVLKILGAIPGLTIVDLARPRVGYMCNSLAPVPAYKRTLHAQELGAAEAAGVDALVGIYHACHRELCAHETTYPFRIVNFLELVGEAMGIDRPDLFKQWKTMQDVDRVLADSATQFAAADLDLDTVRDVLVTAILGEQPLP